MKALSATGGVLASAGIILAGAFLILLSQPVKDLAEIDLGVALGVLIDTFLVRTALVPGLRAVDRTEGRLAGPAMDEREHRGGAGGRAAAIRGGRRAARGRGLAPAEGDPASSAAPGRG